MVGEEDAESLDGLVRAPRDRLLDECRGGYNTGLECLERTPGGGVCNGALLFLC